MAIIVNISTDSRKILGLMVSQQSVANGLTILWHSVEMARNQPIIRILSFHYRLSVGRPLADHRPTIG